MKRKITLTLIIFFVLIISFYLVYPKKNNEILATQKNNSNFLSIMLEKETGTGKYSEGESFPQDGYFLNETLSKCVNGSKIKYEDGSIYITGNKTDRCYAYFDKDELGSICRNQNMAECFIQNYQKDGSIIYHDGESDYEGMVNANLEAGDLSYRYTGGNDIVHNYVCFGSDEENCPHNNLYRIIGFFKNEDSNQYEMKIIKADYSTINETGNNGEYFDYYANSNVPNENRSYLGDKENFYSQVAAYYWNNTTKKNNWKESLLNIENLNNYFYNQYLTPKYQKFIMNHKWYINGDNYRVIMSNPYNTFQYEIKNQNKDERYEAFVGLMYVSDYLYGASSNHWQLVGLNNNAPLTDYRNAITDNWLYMGLSEWTITRFNTIDYGSVGIQYNGSTMDPSIYAWKFAIRPTFYLKNSIKLQSGTGSQESPYRINFE